MFTVAVQGMFPCTLRAGGAGPEVCCPSRPTEHPSQSVSGAGPAELPPVTLSLSHLTPPVRNFKLCLRFFGPLKTEIIKNTIICVLCTEVGGYHMSAVIFQHST